MTTPTPAPAPMTARLRELIDVWVDAADGENERAHHLLDALTARVSRLLEAVEGAEKALGRSDVALDTCESILREKRGPVHERVVNVLAEVRSALATLRAAREGAR